MKTLRISTSIQLFVTVFILLFSFSLPFVTKAQVANECSFNRTLEMGIDGEDVRCLQRYLNESGFKVASEGPGSPGNETSLFRTLTKEAVVRWQTAKGVSPTSGIFGEKSQAAYLLDLVSILQEA